MSSISSHTPTRRRRVHSHDFDPSIYSVGQTLVTIVNDPRASNSKSLWHLAHEIAKETPPPPIDTAKYPNLQLHDFESYLNVVKGTYQQFLSDRGALEASDSGLGQTYGARGDAFLAASQQVPSKYFDEDFDSNWPQLFQQLCDYHEDEELYQHIEHTSKYLDLVELQLLKEVAARSTSFFEAAGSLSDLRTQLGGTLDHVRHLRTHIKSLDETSYESAVTVKRLQRRRANLATTLDVVHLMEEVLHLQNTLQDLLNVQDYAGALELLENVKHMLDSPVLTALHCFRNKSSQVVDTIKVVESLLGEELLAVVQQPGLVNGVVAAVVEQVQAGEDPGSGRTSMSGQSEPSVAGGTTSDDTMLVREQLHDKVLPLVIGLHRAGKLIDVLQQYSEVAGRQVKACVGEVVQKLLPILLAVSGDDPMGVDAEGTSDSQLSLHLQKLHQGAFLQLLNAVFQVVQLGVEHSVLVAQILEDIVSRVKLAPGQQGALRKEFNNVVQAISDAGQGRWVKLLGARTNMNTHLRLYEFKGLLDLSEEFSKYLEGAGAKPLVSFKNGLSAQCRAFLDQMHQRHMTQLKMTLEAEQWVAVELPANFQNIVDAIVSRSSNSGMMQEEECDMSDQSIGAGGALFAMPGSPSRRHDISANGVSTKPTLEFSNKKFRLVNSSLILLKVVDEYLSLHDAVPMFCADIANRTLEVLKVFNTQTCHLVLGAGAMKTAGLKSISAKQLALSCQCISMLATLVPLLRTILIHRVSQPRKALLLPEFDRLLQDLTVHIDEVHAKLVDIMQDRISAVSRQLHSELEASLARARNGEPSDSVKMLAKQLLTLRQVLVPILLPEDISFIFGRVASLYSEQLAEAFDHLVNRNTKWEEPCRQNTLYMMRCFRELPMDHSRAASYLTRLTTFYVKHYGPPPPEMAHILAGQAGQPLPQAPPPIAHLPGKQEEPTGPSQVAEDVAKGAGDRSNRDLGSVPAAAATSDTQADTEPAPVLLPSPQLSATETPTDPSLSPVDREGAESEESLHQTRSNPVGQVEGVPPEQSGQIPRGEPPGSELLSDDHGQETGVVESVVDGTTPEVPPELSTSGAANSLAVEPELKVHSGLPNNWAGHDEVTEEVAMTSLASSQLRFLHINGMKAAVLPDGMEEGGLIGPCEDGLLSTPGNHAMRDTPIEPTVSTQREEREQPRVAPNAEDLPEPRVAPNAEDLPEPRVAPNAEDVPEPRVAPNAEDVPEPRVALNAEDMPEPWASSTHDEVDFSTWHEKKEWGNCSSSQLENDAAPVTVNMGVNQPDAEVLDTLAAEASPSQVSSGFGEPLLHQDAAGSEPVMNGVDHLSSPGSSEVGVMARGGKSLPEGVGEVEVTQMILESDSNIAAIGVVVAPCGTQDGPLPAPTSSDAEKGPESDGAEEGWPSAGGDDDKGGHLPDDTTRSGGHDDKQVQAMRGDSEGSGGGKAQCSVDRHGEHELCPTTKTPPVASISDSVLVEVESCIQDVAVQEFFSSLSEGPPAAGPHDRENGGGVAGGSEAGYRKEEGRQPAAVAGREDCDQVDVQSTATRGADTLMGSPRPPTCVDDVGDSSCLAIESPGVPGDVPADAKHTLKATPAFNVETMDRVSGGCPEHQLPASEGFDDPLGVKNTLRQSPERLR